MYVLLQMQKATKSRDEPLYIVQERGAETRLGRIADGTQALVTDVKDVYCDNFDIFGWCEG